MLSGRWGWGGGVGGELLSWGWGGGEEARGRGVGVCVWGGECLVGEGEMFCGVKRCLGGGGGGKEMLIGGWGGGGSLVGVGRAA